MARTTALTWLLPALIVLGALTWFVPIGDPRFTQEYSDVVIAIAGSWVFLTVWFLSAIINGVLAQRLIHRRVPPGRAWTVLQVLMIAVIVIGSAPTALFELDDDLLGAPLGVVSANVLPWLVVVAAIVQCVALVRRGRATAAA